MKTRPKVCFFRKSLYLAYSNQTEMKKTVFTISSIIALCSMIFLACNKEDNTSTKVTYANQPGVGSGGNPNPNSNPSSSGFSTAGTTGGTTSSTTGGTTTTTGYGSLTDNGSNFTFTTSSACGSPTMTGTSSDGTLQLSFMAAPTPGTYNCVSSCSVSTDVVFVYGGATAPVGNTVSVTTVSGKTHATFSNVVIGAKTLSGTLICQ